ncbi:hypothetical protein [Streptomyces sp. NPDC002133]|uniref:hypothetical protein n=1 Tax=Streptomyces sp. NPDC002133 TaxID=3154409 RepID=UPI003319EC42
MPRSAAPVFLAPLPRSGTAELLGRAAAWRWFEVATAPGRVRGRDVHWYSGPLAADRIGGPLGLGLLEPSDDWLTSLPYELTRRRIRLTTPADAWTLRSPSFVKPPSDKSVPAAVYEDGTCLPRTGERWAVVEANMRWFAQSCAAEPAAILDVVVRAAGARRRVAPTDVRYLRGPAPDCAGHAPR